MERTTRVCRVCGNGRSATEFNAGRDYPCSRICRLCRNARSALRKRIYRRQLKLDTISAYGGKCRCCGETNTELLTIDHVDGHGRHNRANYARIRLDGYPKDKYQLLCWNCNASAGLYGYCPHGGSDSVFDVNQLATLIAPKVSMLSLGRGNWLSVSRLYNRVRFRRIKMEMIDAYGGRCVMCGETAPEFLVLDHINGGGRLDRLLVGCSRPGSSFYIKLRAIGWPKSKYRLLCWNCNSGYQHYPTRVGAIK